MEEILASIRQIISEDGEGADKAAAGQAGASAGAASDTAKETGAAGADTKGSGSKTTEDRDMGARAQADLAKAEEAFAGDDDPDDGDDTAEADEAISETFDDAEAAVADDLATQADIDSDVEESTSMAMPAESKFQSPAPIEESNLLSEDSDQVVHGAFSALAHTILAQNARTLEDLVSEMLQPMLKGWLDDNLPSLVERLVKEEIDRVSRGRR